MIKGNTSKRHHKGKKHPNWVGTQLPRQSYAAQAPETVKEYLDRKQWQKFQLQTQIASAVL